MVQSSSVRALPSGGFRPTVALLAAVLLLGGCTASPPSPGEPTSAPPTTDTIPSPSPTAEGFPSATPSAAAFEFVTVDAEGYGLRPVDESTESVLAWAEQYCEAADLTPCTGIEDRGVPLCIERRDCHPALLVPFDEGPAAFVDGGIFPDPLVIAVWRAESDPELTKHGGARKILGDYLLTVGVCPEELGGDPRGPTCGM
jgi:hypothetical protein